jgi:hypothetical protein
MTRKMLFSLCLLSFALASMIGCSIFHKGTPGAQAKPSEAVKESKGSTIEWGERNWEFYQKDNGGVSYYFDKGTIAFPSKNVMHVWRKREFPQEKPGAGRISSNMKEIVAFDEFDCREGQYRSLEVQGLKWDGTSTEVFRKPSPWSLIYEGTADDYFLNTYCSQTQKKQ